VLILTQDRCTVCVDHTIGSEIVLDALDGTPRRRVSCGTLYLETMLVSMQDRCMVCAKHTIGLEIVFGCT
jgi:hypothetical protein